MTTPGQKHGQGRGRKAGEVTGSTTQQAQGLAKKVGGKTQKKEGNEVLRDNADRAR